MMESAPSPGRHRSVIHGAFFTDSIDVFAVDGSMMRYTG
jgi:hypothetical protein